MSVRLLACLLILTPLAACGADDPAPPVATGTRAVDPATTGSIGGRVVFTGTPPRADVLRMGTDAACVKASGPNPVSDAVLIGADGAIQNVFVHIKAGVDPDYAFPVPATPAVLDQQGCIYRPRVLGVRAGQPIDVLNSDATLHNVHALPMLNQEFNLGQPVKGSRLTRTFTVPEVMVRFKCDVHGWMAAWVGVMAHPFFAVTDASGAFRIEGVPPGQYTVEAWHERFGRRTAEVSLDERGAATVSFEFAAQ